MAAPFFSGVADILDGIICPSLYHASLIEPENARSLVRVVSCAIVAYIYDLEEFESLPASCMGRICKMGALVQLLEKTGYQFSSNLAPRYSDIAIALRSACCCPLYQRIHPQNMPNVCKDCTRMYFDAGKRGEEQNGRKQALVFLFSKRPYESNVLYLEVQLLN